MDFTLSEEQEMLKTMAKDFLTDKYPKSLIKELEEDEKGYSSEIWQEIAELGWMGLVLPEEYGGSGMSFLDLCVLLEEAGKASLSGPLFSTVVLGGLPLLKYGTDEQKQEYLPKIAGGETIVTMAMTEESAGYDAGSIGVKAIADGDDYVIEGTKLFVSDAHVADYILVVARTNSQDEAENGITVFIVDAKSPGISNTLLKVMSGDRLCEAVFDKVKVPKANILGVLDKGWEVAKSAMEYATVAKCCYIVGTMQQALDMTVEYSKERKQYNRPIGSFQVIHHYCANMATDVEGSRFVAFQAAWMLTEGIPCVKEVSMAKAWLNEAFERVSILAHQIHGAIGCTIDHDLHFSTRYGKVAKASYGEGDFHREIVAQEMGL